MYWLIVLAIIALLLYTLTRKSASARPTQKFLSSEGAADEGTNFLPPIPKGFRIYSARLSVAGTQYRHADALRFADGSDQALALERESDNTHDSNAIRVIGVERGTRWFIGYVPRDEAKQVVGSGLAGVVQGRLERIWRSDDGYIYVGFQIIGPKDRKAQYDDFLKGKPADAAQKEFLRFFGLSVPRGLTAGQAAATVAEHRTKLESENKALLDEWEAYEEICDEFNDSDFRSTYDLKEVKLALLKRALDDLTHSGATMRSLADDIDKVVERVLALNPDVERK